MLNDKVKMFNRFLLKLGYSLNNDIKMVLEIVSFIMLMSKNLSMKNYSF